MAAPVITPPSSALGKESIAPARPVAASPDRGRRGTLRGVAGRLGLAPNAIYTYFPTKQALLRAMVERMYSELDRDALTDRSVPSRTRVRRTALDLRAVLLARPGSSSLVMSGPVDGPAAQALGAALLHTLVEDGLGVEDAARAAYAIQVLVIGSVALDQAETAPGQTRGTDDEVYERRRAARGPGGGADSRVIEIVAGYNSAEQLIWSLDKLLDGALGC